MVRKHLVWIMAVLAIALQACSGGESGGNNAVTGVATVSLTDAPGDFDHVWITVKDIWFHTSDAAGPGEGGWLKYPLDAPKTVDLLTLSKGTVGAPVWGNITLPRRHLSADPCSSGADVRRQSPGRPLVL